MYCYKCAILRERKMPSLKPFTNQNYYLQGYTVSTSSFVDVNYVYMVQFVQLFKNLQLQ